MAASVIGCCVPKCGRTRKDDTVLHSFPNPENDMDRYRAWIQAIGLDATSDPHYVYRNRRVCHIHFETKFLTWTRRLSPDAIPTLLVPGSGMARPPLTSITNRIDDIVIHGVPLPSTSRGHETGENLLSREPEKTSENDFLDATIQASSEGSKLQGRPLLKAKRRINQPVCQDKALLAAVKKLTIKKESYQKRLKKALNLSENRTFQNTIKKFTTLAAIFTTMQFREIGKKKMGRRFTEPEKIMALGLYKRSPRTYRWLQKIFVLPSSMTLNRLIASADINPGINENLFRQLKKSVDKMKPDEKLCTLLFDEMALAPHFDYNPRKDEISGFVHNGREKNMALADHALVFMIRGVVKNYKQPIAYMFCSGSTKTADLTISLKDVITKLHSVGLTVLATVCDQGVTNVSAINSLINETKGKYLRNNKLYDKIHLKLMTRK